MTDNYKSAINSSAIEAGEKSSLSGRVSGQTTHI